MRDSRARQRARGPDGRPTPPEILAHSPAPNAAAELPAEARRPVGARGRCCVKRSLRSIGALARLLGSPRPPTSIGSAPGSDPASAGWQTSQEGTLIWSRRPRQAGPNGAFPGSSERARQPLASQEHLRRAGRAPARRTARAPPAHEISGQTSRPCTPQAATNRRSYVKRHQAAIRRRNASQDNDLGAVTSATGGGTGPTAGVEREGRSGQPGVSGRQPGDAASAPPAAPSAPIPAAGQPAGPWRRSAPGRKPCPWRGRVRC